MQKIGMKFVLAVVINVAFPFRSTGQLPDDADQSAFIADINALTDGSWKAGKITFTKDMTKEEIKGLVGTVSEDATLTVRGPILHNVGKADILDYTAEWRDCPGIGEISRQLFCSAGWAFAAVDAMTDMICIFTRGEHLGRVSAQDLLGCCRSCSDGAGSCGIGSPSTAYRYWKEHGIVSGGITNNSGCLPYAPITCGGVPCYTTYVRCDRTCVNGSNIEYQRDKYYAQEVYCVRSTELDIRLEILDRGPVTASFIVYEDFFLYQSGVYKHVKGKEVGWHSVRLIGWNSEGGVKYWLAANSWGKGFGSNGFFKIARGTNECEIESYILAGLPK